VAVVGVMFALLFAFGGKVGYSWEGAGIVIFGLYYYALATVAIDIQVLISAGISHDLWWRPLREMYYEWKRFYP